MKVGPTPNLSRRRLGELDATSVKLLEHGLNVRDLDRSEDQRDLPRRQLGEVRLVHEAKVQADFAARDRSVKRLVAIKEVDLKPKPLLKEGCARRHIADKQDRYDGLCSLGSPTRSDEQAVQSKVRSERPQKRFMTTGSTDIAFSEPS